MCDCRGTLAPMHCACAQRWLAAHPRGEVPKCGACGVPLRISMRVIKGWRPLYYRWDPWERTVAFALSPVLLLVSWLKVTALNGAAHMALGTSFEHRWVWLIILLSWLATYLQPEKRQVGIECRLQPALVGESAID